MTQQDDEKTMR